MSGAFRYLDNDIYEASACFTADAQSLHIANLAQSN
jgi:hypothetical protein